MVRYSMFTNHVSHWVLLSDDVTENVIVNLAYLFSPSKQRCGHPVFRSRDLPRQYIFAYLFNPSQHIFGHLTHLQGLSQQNVNIDADRVFRSRDLPRWCIFAYLFILSQYIFGHVTYIRGLSQHNINIDADIPITRFTSIVQFRLLSPSQHNINNNADAAFSVT